MKISEVFKNIKNFSKNFWFSKQYTYRDEFVFTPKKASWLNMIEIEFSALSRQCLNRRIPSMNQLAKEVFAYFKERNDKGIKIEWQFSRQKARKKLNRHYSKVHSVNKKYK